MPLGILLCPLGLKCVPPVKHVRLHLYVGTLGSFKPLGARDVKTNVLR
jgi:hypothetical protein